MKFLSIIILFLYSALFSQDSLEGTPYSFNNDVGENSAALLTDVVNHNQMLAEDELRPSNSPFRYGKKFEVSDDFFQYAQKDIVNDGYELWRYLLYLLIILVLLEMFLSNIYIHVKK